MLTQDFLKDIFRHERFKGLNTEQSGFGIFKKM